MVSLMHLLHLIRVLKAKIVKPKENSYNHSLRTLGFSTLLLIPDARKVGQLCVFLCVCTMFTSKFHFFFFLISYQQNQIVLWKGWNMIWWEFVGVAGTPLQQQNATHRCVCMNYVFMTWNLFIKCTLVVSRNPGFENLFL